MKRLRCCLSAAFFIVLSPLAACGPEDPRQPTTPPTEDTATEATGNVALTTTPETTVGEATTSEGTLGPSSMDAPEAVLRLEGDEGTAFSGLCNVGGEESVLSGEVPKRFTFEDLSGEGLSCRIQKQDERSGNLRVILLSGDTTRSVQQTNSPGGNIEVSFSG